MRKSAIIVSAALALGGCDMFNAKLPASDVDAAKMCWPVASAKNLDNGGFSLGGMSEVIGYAVVIAKTEQGGSIFDRVNKVTNTKPTDEEAQKLKLNLDSLQGQCRARFPAAAGTVAPTLPSDPVDRADWCLMAATFAESLVPGGVRLTDAERQHVADVKRVAIANFSDAALMAKGFTTQQQVTDYSQKQAETMMGNRIDKVLDACPAS